mmetsp:Transcript_91764/g.256436  ORF Transcript_91764/g.256436 Transcript_91764/m.256436 type:complete len:225 (+) Transcript_91764:922-1596(+)
MMDRHKTVLSKVNGSCLQKVHMVSYKAPACWGGTSMLNCGRKWMNSCCETLRSPSGSKSLSRLCEGASISCRLNLETSRIKSGAPSFWSGPRIWKRCKNLTYPTGSLKPQNECNLSSSVGVMKSETVCNCEIIAAIHFSFGMRPEKLSSTLRNWLKSWSLFSQIRSMTNLASLSSCCARAEGGTGKLVRGEPPPAASPAPVPNFSYSSAMPWRSEVGFALKCCA